MRKSISIHARNCCKQEKERVVDGLQFCEISSSNRAQWSACYRKTAKASGERARKCLLG
jgi:hypothetical protein